MLRGLKSTNTVTRTFFNTVDLLPKDVNFEHGGAKLISCPWRHLTAVRRCPKKNKAILLLPFSLISLFAYSQQFI